GRHARARGTAPVPRARRRDPPDARPRARAWTAAFHRPRPAASAQRMDRAPRVPRRPPARALRAAAADLRAREAVGPRRREPAAALRPYADALAPALRACRASGPGIGRRRVLPRVAPLPRGVRSGVRDRMAAALSGGVRAGGRRAPVLDARGG